jgi:outer membrane lipoprotein SlyB
MEFIMKRILIPVALVALLAGCANPAPSGQVYSVYQTQNEQIVRMGTVESVRNVAIANQDTGVGTVGGAALGGLAGSQVGHGGGSAAVGILGAIAGGVIGNRIENQANTRPGLEITVRLDSGELRAVTQLADEPFRPGDRVRLLTDGNRRTRVTH